jgi:hypothetical protein
MPLDDPHIPSAAPPHRALSPPSPSAGVSSFSDHPQVSQFPGVLEILRLARTARPLDERLEDIPPTRSEELEHRPLVDNPNVNSAYLSSSNSSTSVSRRPTASASDTGRRPDNFGYRLLNHDVPMTQNHSQPHRAHSTSHLTRRRQDRATPPHPGPLSPNSNLWLRELDPDDFSNRLSVLRANALLMRDDLERAIEELAVPLHRPRSDSIPPRNHHRHSSMSTSPRVLETSHSTAESPHHSARSVDEKLEDILFFLDTQLRLNSRPDNLALPTSRFGLSLISECSWLRAGSKFQGIQTFKGSPVPTISSISRQLHALQAFQSKEWTVELVIECIDYLNMSIAGTMTASTILPSSRIQKAKTFWTGEVSPLPLFLDLFL